MFSVACRIVETVAGGVEMICGAARECPVGFGVAVCLGVIFVLTFFI